MNLKPGEILCDECNGTGEVNLFPNQVFNLCPKCLGNKKLTWTENIFGKNLVDFLEADPYVKDHANESEIGSIAYCIKNLSSSIPFMSEL